MKLHPLILAAAGIPALLTMSSCTSDDLNTLIEILNTNPETLDSTTDETYDSNGVPIYGYDGNQPVYGYDSNNNPIYRFADLRPGYRVPDFAPRPEAPRYPKGIHRDRKPPAGAHNRHGKLRHPGGARPGGKHGANPNLKRDKRPGGAPGMKDRHERAQGGRMRPDSKPGAKRPEGPPRRDKGQPDKKPGQDPKRH